MSNQTIITVTGVNYLIKRDMSAHYFVKHCTAGNRLSEWAPITVKVLCSITGLTSNQIRMMLK
jgi:hypothetical protein